MQEKRRNISPVKDRILYYIENLSISKREFYSKTGISRGTLESPTGITEDTLAKFIATYPEVSLEWLIRGEGEIVRPNGPEEAPADLLEMARRVIEAKDEIIELQKNRIDWLKSARLKLEMDGILRRTAPCRGPGCRRFPPCRAAFLRTAVYSRKLCRFFEAIILPMYPYVRNRNFFIGRSRSATARRPCVRSGPYPESSPAEGCQGVGNMENPREGTGEHMSGFLYENDHRSRP